ncbi:MAG: hypothetical protein HRT47_08655 [Candidatus Caenarcaniphilales bacterium]|nr:hypothetical protein [Candidatus Caenarcaniphilales bacterium]
METTKTSQALNTFQYPDLNEELLLAANELELFDSLVPESSKMDIDGLPRENLLDSVVKLSKKRELPLPDSFYTFLDKVAKKEENIIFPRINSSVLTAYMATPFLEKFPLAAKILNEAPRVDLISRALEKIIKSAKRNDLLRIVAGGADILNSLVRPVKDIYLGRSIVVLLTNMAETLEEVFNMKNASYENLADGIHKAVDLVDTSCRELFQNTDKIKRIFKNPNDEEAMEWLRNSGILGIASSATGAMSFLGEITKNTPMALIGRFFQTYLSDGDKFLSNNPDRNHSGFGFTLENAMDNVVRFTDGKVPKQVSKIMLAVQYMISSASRTLAIRSQAAEHKPNMVKIYEQPLKYLRQASANLFRALNPFDTAASEKVDFAPAFV